jgi:hypothetical protein
MLFSISAPQQAQTNRFFCHRMLLIGYCGRSSEQPVMYESIRMEFGCA